MSAPSPTNRPSLLRRWFGWLFGRAAEPPRADDTFFTALGAGRESLSSPRPVLGPSRSGLPPSPLAEAYRNAVAGGGCRVPGQEEASSPATRHPPPATPVWKVLEPQDPTDGVPHQHHVLAYPRRGWTLLGASVRGRLHAHQGLWRDDSFAWAAANDWICLAVADGAGSAPLSRIGSRLAVEEGVKSLASSLAGWQPHPGDDGNPSQEDLRRLRAILADAARRGQAAILAEAEKRGRTDRDFYTTCLLLAHIPFGGADLIGALQVGDGVIGLYSGPGACRVLGEADHGAYGSETRFLTTPGIEEELQQRTVFALAHGLKALALMTDGVSDDFFPEAERLVELFDGDPIAGLQNSQGNPVRGLLHEVVPQPREGQALVDWLHYEKRGSSDDRTLLLLVRDERRGTRDEEKPSSLAPRLSPLAPPEESR
jgi:hypothetical protein